MSGFFKERGLPTNIRSDNGVSARALFNLSKLAVWWLRLGIGVEHIKPGHPQQNGRHERMHLTLKKEATKPAAANFLQQQARFDKFIDVFYNERPHKALEMKCPAEVYQPSPRPYTGLPDIDYPLHDKPSWSPVAAASVWAKRKSISARSLPDKLEIHISDNLVTRDYRTLFAECAAKN